MSAQVGDIILYPVAPSSPWVSKLIGWGQRVIGQDPSKEAYSHVAIVGPDLESQYEAWFPRVRNTRLRLGGAEVYRIIGITPTEINKGMLYLQSQVGKLYPLINILSFGLIQVGGQEVCSQLAFNYGLAMDKVLFGPTAFATPDDVAASLDLVRVA